MIRDPGRSNDPGGRELAPRGPVFITGLSRSGKTELRRLLEARDGVAMYRRSHLWSRFHSRFGDLGRPENLEACLAEICRSDEVTRLQPDLASVLDRFAEGAASYDRLFAAFYDDHAARTGARVWGLQSGDVSRFASGVLEQIPGSKFVYMVRDPRSRAAATSRGRLVGGVGWETAKWIESVRDALSHAERHPERFMILRCEDLADRPLSVLTDVEGFLGWAPQGREGHEIHHIEWAKLLAGASSSGKEQFVERRSRTLMAAVGYRTCPQPAPWSVPGDALWLPPYGARLLVTALDRKRRRTSR